MDKTKTSGKIVIERIIDENGDGLINRHTENLPIHEVIGLLQMFLDEIRFGYDDILKEENIRRAETGKEALKNSEK